MVVRVDDASATDDGLVLGSHRHNFKNYMFVIHETKTNKYTTIN